MSATARHLACLAALASLLPPPAQAEGIVDALVRRFSESEFEFLRGAQTNAPFLPIAWVSATDYQKSEFTRAVDGGESDVEFHQTAFSEGAFLPIPIGKRDAFVIGEWVSLTKFDLRGAANRDLDVYSVALPLGWFRQSSPDWQVAAFVAPLGHKSNVDDWYVETLGGVFGRYMESDRLAWLVGFYFDVAPLEDFYTPYIGLTYIVNERWTINGVLPWPGVTYAPTTDMQFRLGVMPSGASWSIEPGARRPRVDLDQWNFGFAAEHRIYKSIWAAFEVGVSAIRGLTFAGGDWQAPDVDLDNAGFVLLTLNVRPGQ